jgi:hypothetical protein
LLAGPAPEIVLGADDFDADTAERYVAAALRIGGLGERMAGNAKPWL